MSSLIEQRCEFYHAGDFRTIQECKECQRLMKTRRVEGAKRKRSDPLTSTPRMRHIIGHVFVDDNDPWLFNYAKMDNGKSGR